MDNVRAAGLNKAFPTSGDNLKASRAKAARLKKAAVDFEALFINHMLKTMRSTISKSGLLGDGMREDVYTSLFDWEISKVMASSRGLGLGEMLTGDLRTDYGASPKKLLPRGGSR